MTLFFGTSAALVFAAVYYLAGRSKRKQKISARAPSEETKQPASSTARAAVLSTSDVQELRAYVDALRGRKALELKESMQGLLQKYAEEDEGLITSLKEKEAELEAKRRPVGLDPEEQAALTRLIAKETRTEDEQIWLSRLLNQAGNALEAVEVKTKPENPDQSKSKGRKPKDDNLIRVTGA